MNICRIIIEYYNIVLTIDYNEPLAYNFAYNIMRHLIEKHKGALQV